MTISHFAVLCGLVWNSENTHCSVNRVHGSEKHDFVKSDASFKEVLSIKGRFAVGRLRNGGCAVPTGTVLLVTSTVYFLIFRPNVRATSSTYFRSADPSSSGGVPFVLKHQTEYVNSIVS